jgi:3-hydroxy-9,10-secoandrosta-1,3,5(10)-triene-9,17-dione monooxygenase
VRGASAATRYRVTQLMNAPTPNSHSFTNTAYEDTLREMRDLVPMLRERAAQAEAARTMPPETINDLKRTGALRILQPKRWGGMEYDFISYIDVPMELARGCASTSWNVVNLSIHNWMLALYDERAQADVWGKDPDALIAAGIAYPQGRARKADGGFVISGKWNFSSGVNLAEWCMLAVIVRDGDKVIDHRMCLLDKSQYEVVDDWHTLGMRSTGSMTVVAKDVFVPEYRALCAYDIRGGATFPGAKGNPNPVYRVSLNALGGHGIAATACGNAMAALEHTLALVKERSTNYTGLKMRDQQIVQHRVSTAAAKIESAKLMLRTDALAAQDEANHNVIPDMQQKLRYKRNAAYAASLCVEAVDALHVITGATGIYQSHPLERIFRDAHALGAHISLNFDAQAPAWGLAALGGDVVNLTL